MDYITYDEAVEIAAEVAEQTVKTFLKNLMKLVPTEEETVDELQEAHYRELKALKAEKTSAPVVTESAKTKKEKPIIDILDEDTDDEFAAIAHPAQNKLNEAYNIDDALSQIPLERSDLFGEAAQSPVD